ncbi:MAG: DUF262 domain-containing protein [Bacteroidetes bacterium]|nr:DUF262 domain-containing protein [Bacteroidota bacterium]
MSKTTPLIDLFGEKFIIPHYQRGYRWEAQEVTELLDDLWSFWKTSKGGEFYCLQPIVLQKNEDGSYNVLDGQQRLTTLYLILVYLEERRIEDGYSQKLFSLNYETRTKCEEFLNNKKFTATEDDTNIDFSHICNAYASIKEWFEKEKHKGAKGKLVPILMDNNDTGNRNVRFIKYEVEKDTNPIEVFIRLNVGKIPLTDAELTKALLLQSDKYHPDELKFIKMKLFEIASEWDSIEYTLQNEEFWYFLSNEANGKPTHIEFIFELIADKIQKEKKYFDTKPIKHATFLILSEYLDDLLENEKKSRIDAVEHIWESVIEYFEHFKDWFNNRRLFHYIGYLISEKRSSIDTLILKSKSLTKSKFEEYLESEISKNILITKTRTDADGNLYNLDVQSLRYEYEDQNSTDKSEIHKILLLHNVFTTLKSEKEKARFPFNLYKQTKKNEKWSLEHIHAQNSENIVRYEYRITWLSDHLKSLRNLNQNEFQELIQRMESAIKLDKIEDLVFDSIVEDVYSAINKYSGITESNKHSIENLCLIDAPTNSKLNNSVFDVKREIIKSRELEGFYIPICTRNVFLKAYSEYPPNNAYWDENDRKHYLNSLEETYNFFTNRMID